MMPKFSPEARSEFAQNYPETPHTFRHGLTSHPLLTFERLAQLAEDLTEDFVEYSLADLPIAVNGKPDKPALSAVEMIRSVESAGSWAVLRNIERDPEYALLLNDLLGELRQEIEAKTGEMIHCVGFIFVTSPGGVTPCHFDPEHNILLQIRGSKTMTQFPVGDERFASDELHEIYHAGGPREIPWNKAHEEGGTQFQLEPGDALFVPVMAPHFVRNGPEPSISLSITWRSNWSYADADARVFNSILRRMGFKPNSPGRWPRHNLAKAYGYRALRKLGTTRTSLFQPQ